MRTWFCKRQLGCGSGSWAWRPEVSAGAKCRHYGPVLGRDLEAELACMAQMTGRGPDTRRGRTVYDPTRGSRSHLIRAAEQGPGGRPAMGGRSPSQCGRLREKTRFWTSVQVPRSSPATRLPPRSSLPVRDASSGSTSPSPGLPSPPGRRQTASIRPATNSAVSDIERYGTARPDQGSCRAPSQPHPRRTAPGDPACMVGVAKQSSWSMPERAWGGKASTTGFQNAGFTALRTPPSDRRELGSVRIEQSWPRLPARPTTTA